MRGPMARCYRFMTYFSKTGIIQVDSSLVTSAQVLHPKTLPAVGFHDPLACPFFAPKDSWSHVHGTQSRRIVCHTNPYAACLIPQAEYSEYSTPPQFANVSTLLPSSPPLHAASAVANRSPPSSPNARSAEAAVRPTGTSRGGNPCEAAVQRLERFKHYIMLKCPMCTSNCGRGIVTSGWSQG